jgi:hypothetical protein
MSKHIGRKQRWTQDSAKQYSSAQGKVVYQENAWYAILAYKTCAPQEEEAAFPTWVAQTERLGPYKRPRNAMVALEREVTALKNRHGKDVLFGDQLRAEA